MKILVTGGAGFIGLHLVRRLLHEGCSISVLDNFSPQVHAGAEELPRDIAPEVELFRGDVRDRELLRRAVIGQDVVVHFAAETGTGQSMYEVVRYQDVNIGGTAALIDCIINEKKNGVRKLIVASSRAIYGEGKYSCAEHKDVYPEGRLPEELRRKQFEPLCPKCDQPCSPRPTDESSPPRPLSFYGLTKYVQEQMVLMFARARGLSGIALRYQNVYGPGQSLSNPYTGILAIFAQLAGGGAGIEIFEDGDESRDFVFVDDVVEATWRCIAFAGDLVDTFNVGSGLRTTVLHVAEQLVRILDSDSKISISGAFRQGDIRHNFADLNKIRCILGYDPQVTFEEGVRAFVGWAGAQRQATLKYELSLRELRERGLLHG